MPQTQTIQNTPAQGESLVYAVRCRGGRVEVHELIVRNTGKSLLPRRTPEGETEFNRAFGDRAQLEVPSERKPVMQKAMSTTWYGFDRAQVIEHAAERIADARARAYREYGARVAELNELVALMGAE